MGAIGEQIGPGPFWTIQNIEARWNHGAAIRLQTTSHLVGSLIHDNGQLGVSGGGLLVLVENNEIYNNGRGGVDWHWEGGGTKFYQTDKLVVRGNKSHDNLGPGFWTDGDNIHALYENNIVTQNEGPGIFHEISMQVTICNNTIKDNGTFVDPGWIWDAGIQIATSSDAVIYGNTIEVNSLKYAHGISYLQQNRGSGIYGVYRAANNYAYNNDVKINGPNARGAAGVVQDYSGTGDIYRSNNRFDFNTYHIPDLRVTYFVWADSWMNWAQWRASGQDPNGTAGQQ
jgi:parallel beta-helix repeat protein